MLPFEPLQTSFKLFYLEFFPSRNHPKGKRGYHRYSLVMLNSVEKVNSLYGIIIWSVFRYTGPSVLMVSGECIPGIRKIKIFTLFAIIMELIYSMVNMYQNSFGKIRIDEDLNVYLVSQNII